MLLSEMFRSPTAGEARRIAVFSFRYDAHLVSGLIENIRPAVHGYVAWDDRAAGAALSDEPMRRNLLLAEARRLGADWILACDPDERFEARLAEALPEMVAQGPGNLWSFDLREMIAPDRYRVDGLWGGKLAMRFFPLAAVGDDLTVALHAQWVAGPDGFRPQRARLNIYHLRMASPTRRRLRRALYAAADPGRRFQSVGYDYLDDERGMKLQVVPEGRGFQPAFVEDHGLWAPDPGVLGAILPDPPANRLHFVARSAERAGQAAAVQGLRDLCDAMPGDADLSHALARRALAAGQPELALQVADRLAADGDLHAQLVRAQAAARLGLGALVQDSLSLLAKALPGSPVVDWLATTCARDSADFTAPGALWRRWAGTAARICEGPQVRAAGMAVVVLGLRAQPGLAAAVRSLLAQEEAAEIVVVNSGGGDAAGVLGPLARQVRLIEVEAPLFAGAVRNIGVDASRAPFVAFLAGDCTAAPGWVSGRMRRHRAGALSVASPVIAADPACLTGVAAHYLHYWGRDPRTTDRLVMPYGRSFARWLLDEVGAFPPGLRVDEDGVLNRLVDRLALPVWAPEVQTAHRDPPSLRALLAEERQRGRRRADHAPFRDWVGDDGAVPELSARVAQSFRAAQRAAADWGGLSPRRLASVQAMQWLALQAGTAGATERMEHLFEADLAQARAEALRRVSPAAALVEAAAARSADPQDWGKALLCGVLRAETGTGDPIPDLRAACALDPTRSEPVAALVALHRARGDLRAALAEAEAAATRAPLVAAHWTLAAQVALMIGEVDRALAWHRAALAQAPDRADTHADLAALHRQRGDSASAEARSGMAQALRQVAGDAD